MKRIVEIYGFGSSLPDAFEQVLAGFFFKSNPSPDAIRDAKSHNETIYKFKMTLELLDEEIP